MPALKTETTETSERDYDAFWQTHYEAAKAEGMSDDMARFVTNNETHDQMLADKGLKPYGAGDFEELY